MKSIFHAAAFPAESEKNWQKKTEIRQFVQITQVSPSIYFIKKQQQRGGGGESVRVRAAPFKLRLTKAATPSPPPPLPIVCRLSFNAFRSS